MFFDVLTLSNKLDNPIIKKLNKYYETSCKLRKCITQIEIKKCIKERFPDILLFIIEEKINKAEDKFIKNLLSKYPNLNVIICANNKEFLDGYLNSSKRIFLEIGLFEKNYKLIFDFILKNVEYSNKEKYGNYPILFSEVVGNSIASRKLQSAIKKTANNKAKILLTGKMGNEYEDVAFLIHKNSNRKKYNFVTYDVALNPQNILKKLFGIVENRKITKRSLLEYTYNGTIFIKNIHLLNKEDRESFISFLRNESFSRLNSKNKLKTNNKIITYIPDNAIEKFLSKSINKELYDRISTNIINIPSLKKRKEDFVLICNFIIQKICREFNCDNQISKDEILKLSYFNWNGNIDELFFYLKLLIKNRLNGQPNIPKRSSNATNINIYNQNLKNAKKEFEIDYINKQLERFGGHITNTAKFIGMNRVALHKKIKDLKIRLKK